MHSTTIARMLEINLEGGDAVLAASPFPLLVVLCFPCVDTIGPGGDDRLAASITQGVGMILVAIGLTVMLGGIESVAVDRRLLRLLLREFEFWYLVAASLILLVSAVVDVMVTGHRIVTQSTALFNLYVVALFFLATFHTVGLVWIFMYDASPERSRWLHAAILLAVEAAILSDYVSRLFAENGGDSNRLCLGNRCSTIGELLNLPAALQVIIFIAKQLVTIVFTNDRAIIRSPARLHLHSNSSRSLSSRGMASAGSNSSVQRDDCLSSIPVPDPNPTLAERLSNAFRSLRAGRAGETSPASLATSMDMVPEEDSLEGESPRRTSFD